MSNTGELHTLEVILWQGQELHCLQQRFPDIRLFLTQILLVLRCTTSFSHQVTPICDEVQCCLWPLCLRFYQNCIIGGFFFSFNITCIFVHPGWKFPSPPTWGGRRCTKHTNKVQCTDFKSSRSPQKIAFILKYFILKGEWTSCTVNGECFSVQCEPDLSVVLSISHRQPIYLH